MRPDDESRQADFEKKVSRREIGNNDRLISQQNLLDQLVG